MTKKEIEKLNTIIKELDTATGKLIVSSLRDSLVKEAMDQVINASIDLGNMVDEASIVNQWISANEKLPDENGNYLCITANEKTSVYNFHDGKWRFKNDKPEFNGEWCHPPFPIIVWMPLTHNEE